MLEQIALGVGIGVFQPQFVDQGDDLGQHRRLVDREPRLRHEAHAVGVADLDGRTGKTSSRTQVTSCSPDIALAQDDQRMRSRGTVSIRRAGAFSGLRKVQSPANRLS